MAPDSIRPTASTRAFGTALKRARRAAHLTQAELAERAGFSVVYISMLERGARQPQPSTVTLLADALELTAPDRAVLEAAAQAPAAPPRRSRDSAEAPHFPVGGFLGALPAGQLVGRERELAVVDEALAAVAGGQGRLLVLVGEPGVGKTRLAQEITLKARVQGFRIISGRCYEPQQSVAYYPFLEALAMAAAGANPLLQAQLPERWPEVARLLPERLASVQSPLQLDDRNAQQRLFWQLSGFLGALAEQTPLAVLLDDLQWADSASMDLLLHLTRQTRDHPILLVETAREVEAARQHPLADAISDLRRDELMKQLLLSPLAAAETSALIGATLGGADGAAGNATSVSSDLAQRIHVRSEGNAFFIRQLTRALHEQGDLSFSEGRWDLSAQGATFTAPESIRAVIGQRLGHLTAHTQEVLREASVLGQVVAFEELRRLGGRGKQEVEEAVEEASGAGIIREGDHDRYHFNHALTRDTLYADLPARRKRRLHRAAAEAIEQTTEHERRAAELSYHLLAADESERALPYALLAGDQAEAVYAHAEAESHYRAALAAAQEVGDASHEALALEKLGHVVHLLGRSDEAPGILDRALRSYQALQDQEGGSVRSLHGYWRRQSLGARSWMRPRRARTQSWRVSACQTRPRSLQRLSPRRPECTPISHGSI
jgi:predicted ATPase/DNA-binding XRE family transcriptional regulator